MVGLVKKGMIGFALVVVLALTGCTKDSDQIQIGISQFVAHPALDRTREGFIAGLEERGFKDGEKIKIVVQNSAADFTQADLIARNFVTDKVDLIFAIATPSAQAAKNATEDSKIPVLFSAVTDAEVAGLVETNEKPGGNVSGTSDMSPMDKQLDLITAVLGEGQKVGVLFNTGEVNSVVQVEIIEGFASDGNHTIVKRGVTNTQELLDALTLMVDEVDVFLIPTDNLMASNIELIVEKAKEANIPVIGTESGMVEAGALMTEGLDYFDLGFQTGLMAADLFEGKVKVGDIPVEIIDATKLELIINLDTAEALGITIPEALLNRAAKTIEGGVLNE